MNNSVECKALSGNLEVSPNDTTSPVTKIRVVSDNPKSLELSQQRRQTIVTFFADSGRNMSEFKGSYKVTEKPFGWSGKVAVYLTPNKSDMSGYDTIQF
jgi:hypothetical protein